MRYWRTCGWAVLTAYGASAFASATVGESYQGYSHIVPTSSSHTPLLSLQITSIKITKLAESDAYHHATIRTVRTVHVQQAIQ